MKKTIAFIFIMAMCAFLCVGADAKTTPCTIIGTGTHTNNFASIGVGNENTTEQAGALTIKTLSTENATGKYPAVTYTFTATSAGAYVLSLEASNHSYPQYFSPYSVSVNGGAYFRISGDNATECNADNNISGYLYSISTSLTFTLNKGSNTFTFRLDAPRTADNRAYAFFKSATFTGTDMLINDNMNIFEADEDVTFDVGSSINYTLTNYYGNVVASGNSVNQNGTWNITLGRLPIGHYMLKANGMSEYFAVVKPYSQREHISDSPFAADCASLFLVDIANIDTFANAIKLAGIKWIRDRVRWGVVNPSVGNYDFSSLDKYVDAFNSRGINISETFHSAPGFTKNSGSVLPDNLLYAYSFAKTAGARYAGKVQAWEIWNEPDISFTGANEPADKYAGVLKAMSIGFNDGDANALISTAGFANVPGEYNNLLFSNQINNYFDIYNQHTHRSADSSKNTWSYADNVTAHSNFATGYSAYDKPIWTGEAGVSMDLDDGSDISWAQQKLSARYLVTSTAEALSKGESKHFWFVMPYYLENGKSWGAFSSRSTPYASYSAASNITDELGAGTYYGKLNIDGANGYCFNNNGDYVAVLWSENATTVNLKIDGTSVAIDDIIGTRTTQNVTDGVLTLSIGPDPIYVHADGFKDVTLSTYIQKTITQRTLGANERIVVTQDFPNSLRTDSKVGGYRLTPSTRTAVTVNVYNFNNTDQQVQLSVKAYGGFKIESGTKLLTVSANSKQSYTYYITADGTQSCDNKYPVAIRAITSCGLASRSVTYVSVVEDGAPTVLEKLPGVSTYRNWSNSMPSGTTCARSSVDDGMQFVITFKESTGDKYCYPMLNLRGTYDYSAYSGMAVTVNADASAAGNIFRLFVVEDSGAHYYTSIGYTLVEGTQTFRIPWSRFVWQGGTTDSMLNTDSITAIRVGVNASNVGPMTISVTNLGLYGSDSHIMGTIDETAFDGENLVAVLGDTTVPYSLDNAAAIIDGKEYPLTVANGMAIGTLKAPAGTHNAIVRVYNESGYAVCDALTINTDGYVSFDNESIVKDSTNATYSIDVSNLTAERGSYDAYLVGYDANGRMVTVLKTTVTLEANGTYSINLTQNAQNISKYKAFIWDSTTQQPKKESYED